MTAPGGTLHIYDTEQRSDEWYALRAGVLTASTVGHLIATRPHPATDHPCPECGAGPGGPCLSKAARREPTPVKTIHPARAEAAALDPRPPLLVPADTDASRGVTATLTAERITGNIDETRITSDMWRGIEDEPHARDAYAEQHAPVEEVGFMIRTFANGHRLGYSPDGLVGDDGLIEIKSRLQKVQLTDVLAGVIPAAHVPQLQCGLLVSGRAWIDYVSYCGGMPLLVVRAYPDPRWFAAITAALNEFEARAADLIERYTTATDGLPVTVRVPRFEEMTV